MLNDIYIKHLYAATKHTDGSFNIQDNDIVHLLSLKKQELLVLQKINMCVNHYNPL